MKCYERKKKKTLRKKEPPPIRSEAKVASFFLSSKNKFNPERKEREKENGLETH
jgi:hypothetical protein